MPDHRLRRFRADHRRELGAACPADARHRPERRQSLAAATRPNARNVVELGPEIPHRSGAAVERHRKSMRFIADPLHEEQCGVVFREHHRGSLVAREEQLLFLRNPDGNEVAEPNLLECVVCGRERTIDV